MSSEIYEKRQKNLREVLDKDGVDGILITNLTNIRYISGFTGSAASCLFTPEGKYFITDGRYIEQSKSQVKGFERFISMDSHLQQIKTNKLNPDGLKLAFEGSHMSFALYETMTNLFPNTQWKNSSMILEDLASVKDQYELECIRTAVEVTDVVYKEILPMLRPGYTEKQVANTLVSKYREYAEGEAYSPIVATGPNGALPHAIPTDREFRAENLLHHGRDCSSERSPYGTGRAHAATNERSSSCRSLNHRRASLRRADSAMCRADGCRVLEFLTAKEESRIWRVFELLLRESSVGLVHLHPCWRAMNSDGIGSHA